ncbi:hypothetical protein [Streptomyces lavendulae]|uniref:hypothetical protein n=1 Tax=Streptomyces lavendulae TaxID=1914 RepID=UPI00383051B7
MSYNQPGPYGQQPQQPGPYGQQPPPPPGPYGQPAPQPGYGYPQQTPPPPGYPQQSPPPPPAFPQQGGYQQTPQPPQPAYGYQQQPPQQGYMPPPQPPKKSKAGPVIAVVLVVAVIGGAGWWFLGGGSGGSVSDATKGYKLTFPAAVDSYQKAPETAGAPSPDAPLTGDKKIKAEALGVQNAHSANAKYQVGTDPKGKSLSASGLWGDIADPAKAIDSYYAGLSQNNSETEKIGLKYEVVGTPKEFSPAGFKGAVMKCANIKLINLKPSATGKEPKEIQVPSCAWGDHSTLVGVNAIDPAALLVGGNSGTLDEVAALAAKLYNTSRTKA